MNSKYKIDRRTRHPHHSLKVNGLIPESGSRFKLDKRIIPPKFSTPILKSRFCKINNLLSLKRDSSLIKNASTSYQSSQQQQAASKIVSKYKLKNNYNPSPVKSTNSTGKTTRYLQNSTFSRQNVPADNRFKRKGTPNSKYKLVKTNSTSTVNRVALRNRNFKFCKLNVRRKSNNKFKKTNIGSSTRKLCPYFIRYGKCKLDLRCPLYHDTSAIMICPKFLKNRSCDPAKCHLSHEYSKDKMPLCHFFLKGACGRSNCPYLHIKHKKDANVCLKFKAGYCPNGAKCGMLHLERCQDNKLVYRRKSVSKRRTSEMQRRISGRRMSRKLENFSHSTDAISGDKNSPGSILPSFIKLPDNPLVPKSLTSITYCIEPAGL